MKSKKALINGITVKSFRLLTEHVQDSADYVCGFAPGRFGQCERATRSFTDDEIAIFCKAFNIKRREFRLARDIFSDAHRKVTGKQRAYKE